MPVPVVVRVPSRPLAQNGLLLILRLLPPTMKKLQTRVVSMTLETAKKAGWLFTVLRRVFTGAEKTIRLTREVTRKFITHRAVDSPALKRRAKQWNVGR